MELPLSHVLDVSEAEILSMESDCVWIKGEKIGCTEYCYPPRRYTVKPGILKKRTQSDCYPAGCKLRNWRVCAQQPYYLETGRSAWSLPAFGSMLRKRGQKPQLLPFCSPPVCPQDCLTPPYFLFGASDFGPFCGIRARVTRQTLSVTMRNLPP